LISSEQLRNGLFMLAKSLIKHAKSKANAPFLKI